MEPNGETQLEAAQRELAEEMGYETTADNWIALGTYRTSANRGAGSVTCYLARDAHPIKGQQRPISDEMESQQIIRLTKQQLLQVLYCIVLCFVLLPYLIW
jgi:8-oxo-dGTP pyrophosphatase MutT (NUDIX family)